MKSQTDDHHPAFLALDAEASEVFASVVRIRPDEYLVGDSCAELSGSADAEMPVTGNACHYVVEEPQGWVGIHGGGKGLETNTARQNRQSCEERRRVPNHSPTLFSHFEAVERRDFDVSSDSGYSCRGVVQVGDGGHRIAWFLSSGGLNSTC